MRYLRLLSNSLAAAILATCYVLILLLQLNPRLPLDPRRLVPIAESVGVFYVVHLMAMFYAMLVTRQLLAREPLSPAWISVGVLSWLGAIAAAAGSALMWANVRTFGLVLPPDIVSDMMRGGLALAVSALLFVLVALGRRNSDGRQRFLWASCFVVVAAVSLATPIFFRGPGVDQPLEARPLDVVLDMPPPERAAKVAVIAIDGGSLDLIARATAEGRLPNFGRIIDSGAAMRLATLHPTSAEAVWTAVATGKLPQKNGVRSAAVYRTGGDVDPIRLLPDFCYASGLMRFGVLTEEPLTSAALRARPLWSILSLLGIRVGVLNWPLTYPGADRARLCRERAVLPAVTRLLGGRRSGGRLSARSVRDTPPRSGRDRGTTCPRLFLLERPSRCPSVISSRAAPTASTTASASGSRARSRRR